MKRGYFWRNSYFRIFTKYPYVSELWLIALQHGRVINLIWSESLILLCCGNHYKIQTSRPLCIDAVTAKIAWFVSTDHCVKTLNILTLFVKHRLKESINIEALLLLVLTLWFYYQYFAQVIKENNFNFKANFLWYRHIGWENKILHFSDWTALPTSSFPTFLETR